MTGKPEISIFYESADGSPDGDPVKLMTACHLRPLVQLWQHNHATALSVTASVAFSVAALIETPRERETFAAALRLMADKLESGELNLMSSPAGGSA